MPVRTSPKKEEIPEPKSGRKFIIIAVIILLVIGAGIFYWRSTFTEDTDDAQVDGDLYQVSSRITGQVVKVYVDDNQQVKVGDPIAEIDPTRLSGRRRAGPGQPRQRAGRRTSRPPSNVPITSVSVNTTVSTTGSDVQGSTAAVEQARKQEAAAEARVTAAKANAVKSHLDVERYTPLVQKDVISKQQFDAAVAADAANQAAVLEAEANADRKPGSGHPGPAEARAVRAPAAAESVKNGPEQVRAQQAKANAALATRQTAAGQARSGPAQPQLHPHHRAHHRHRQQEERAGRRNVSIGQDLLTIIPLTNLWVTANFKETQLGKMQRRPGRHHQGRRPRRPQVPRQGHPDRRSHRFTPVLFPPENATGNYVKVVQRIPVRIDFTNLQQEDGDFALRPGMSVTPEVEVK